MRWEFGSLPVHLCPDIVSRVLSYTARARMGPNICASARSPTPVPLPDSMTHDSRP